MHTHTHIRTSTKTAHNSFYPPYRFSTRTRAREGSAQRLRNLVVFKSFARARKRSLISSTQHAHGTRAARRHKLSAHINYIAVHRALFYPARRRPNGPKVPSLSLSAFSVQGTTNNSFRVWCRVIYLPHNPSEAGHVAGAPERDARNTFIYFRDYP